MNPMFPPTRSLSTDELQALMRKAHADRAAFVVEGLIAAAQGVRRGFARLFAASPRPTALAGGR